MLTCAPQANLSPPSLIHLFLVMIRVLWHLPHLPRRLLVASKQMSSSAICASLTKLMHKIDTLTQNMHVVKKINLIHI